MKTFNYTVKDPVGIHAGPAGLIARKAREFPGTEIILENGDKTVNVTKLMALMGMGVRGGDTVTITLTGGDEEAAMAGMKELLEKHL